MSRTFAYARVSTADQTVENQRMEIEKAGFKVEPRHMVAETISGSVPAGQRPGFAKLFDKLDEGDTLVVTRLDRLGRDAIDVMQTIRRLEMGGVRVVCLALGAMDLTSAVGGMTLGVLAAVAEFEKALLIERTQSGLARAKAEGKVLGRPAALTKARRAEVRAALDAGETVSAVARRFNTSRTTIQRARAEA